MQPCQCRQFYVGGKWVERIFGIMQQLLGTILSLLECIQEQGLLEVGYISYTRKKKPCLTSSGKRITWVSCLRD